MEDVVVVSSDTDSGFVLKFERGAETEALVDAFRRVSEARRPVGNFTYVPSDLVSADDPGGRVGYVGVGWA